MHHSLSGMPVSSSMRSIVSKHSALLCLAAQTNGPIVCLSPLFFIAKARQQHDHVQLDLSSNSDALLAEKSDVLVQEPRAGVLRPSFCLVRDEQLQCIVLAIRGTHSLKVIIPAFTYCFITLLCCIFGHQILLINIGYKFVHLGIYRI